ncbi:MAG: tRNA guanosine(34) transglycosylase Tgt [Patescibacteria group bacterium]
MQNLDFLKQKIHFFPDATYGSIQTISFEDAKNIGIKGIVTTTLPSWINGVDEFSEKFDGVKNFFGWEGKVLTDSGGFQVFSLIHKKGLAKKNLSDEGAIFTDFKNGKKYLLTPEISQQVQFRLKSDFRVVLDEPVPDDASREVVKKSLERTFDWAERAKKEFLKLENLTEKEFSLQKKERPLLFAVVQGGQFLDLREDCAKVLNSIGFDGFGFGGVHFDANKKIKIDLLETLPKNLPSDKIFYGMGIGTPDNIVTCAKIGYTLFDCVLPTRNARHGFLYVSKGQGDVPHENYDDLHIENEKYKFDKNPIDKFCDCEVCKNKNLTRSYIRHLLKMREPVGHRFTTIHNLRFFIRLVEQFE